MRHNENQHVKGRVKEVAEFVVRIHGNDVQPAAANPIPGTIHRSMASLTTLLIME